MEYFDHNDQGDTGSDAAPPQWVTDLREQNSTLRNELQNLQQQHIQSQQAMQAWLAQQNAVAARHAQQTPAQERSAEEWNKRFYEDPYGTFHELAKGYRDEAGRAIEETRQHTARMLEAEKQNNTWWGEFYSDYPQLQGVRQSCLTLANNMPELTKMSGEKGREALAAAMGVSAAPARKQSQGAATVQGQGINQGPARVASPNGRAASPPGRGQRPLDRFSDDDDPYPSGDVIKEHRERRDRLRRHGPAQYSPGRVLPPRQPRYA